MQSFPERAHGKTWRNLLKIGGRIVETPGLVARKRATIVPVCNILSLRAKIGHTMQ